MSLNMGQVAPSGKVSKTINVESDANVRCAAKEAYVTRFKKQLVATSRST